jgi:cytochrome c-type biogenesis protein CcmH/NrfF
VTNIVGTTVVLAHHSLVAALPFVVPTLLITLMVVVMAVRDRRRDDHGEEREAQRPG